MKNRRLAAALTAAALVLACQQTSNQANNTADPTVQGTPYTPPPGETTTTAQTASADPTVQGTPYTPAPTTQPQTQPQISSAARDSVKRVGVQEARQMIARGAVVVDVRPAEAFSQGHIPGALNIPFASVQGEIPNLPKGKEIVVYCA